MPATMTFKIVKEQALLLPKKQKSMLAEALLQDEYEAECLRKVKETHRGIKNGTISEKPLDVALRDLETFRKSLKK